jgi:NAD(P)-dependent dehydrogenase (short-subunit alcohol dehydrogenase family)
MNGRTALVTGGSRGIGYAVVERFRELGARVLAPTRAELDLADGAAVEAYAAALSEPVDVLVNNAGINPLAGIDELTDDALVETLAVNLTAPLRLCRALAPGMAARGYGRIVNVSSVWTVVGKARRVPYTVSKSGLNGLTTALAVELAPCGVLVNAVAPGIVATELTSRNNTPAQIAALVEQIPLGRLAEAEELAELIVFLSSARNSYLTGQVLVCDGGLSCV